MSNRPSSDVGKRLYSVFDQTATREGFCKLAGHMLPKLTHAELQAVWYAMDCARTDGLKFGSTYDDHVGN